MPVGHVIGTAAISACTLLALRPFRRPAPLAALSHLLALSLNELPFAMLYLLAGSTALTLADNDVDSPAGWATVGLVALPAAGLVVVARRASLARPATRSALAAGLGPAARMREALPWARILLAPLVIRRRDVRRVPDISYGDAGGRNMLDLYLPRRRAPDGPTLVYFHGGRFRGGHKRREGRVLLYRLASQGWTCVSANYRLQPRVRFPEHHVDAKRVIAWVREHGAGYGADASRIFVAGSSAGAHMAALAALTPNDPRFQPGFEGVDTAVEGAICMYGYYGPMRTTTLPSSPCDYVSGAAPPFFVAHGDLDPVVSEDSARGLVGGLRSRSRNPVVYAELPGAQHAFDLFHSVRNDTVVAAVEAFAGWVLARNEPAGR